MVHWENPIVNSFLLVSVLQDVEESSHRNSTAHIEMVVVKNKDGFKKYWRAFIGRQVS